MKSSQKISLKSPKIQIPFSGRHPVWVCRYSSQLHLKQQYFEV